MEKNSSNYRLLSGLFFRLLPFQVLLLIITSVNGIVDSLYASNQIGQSCLSAVRRCSTGGIWHGTGAKSTTCSRFCWSSPAGWGC